MSTLKFLGSFLPATTSSESRTLDDTMTLWKGQLAELLQVLPIYLWSELLDLCLGREYEFSRTTMNRDGGNPMGSAVKKNGREGTCERKLLRAVLKRD